MQLVEIISPWRFIMGQIGKNPVDRLADLDCLMKNRFSLSRGLPPFR